MSDTRPSWDETWMSMADVIALRSKCSRRQAGTIIVGADNRIVASGYNGPPANWKPTQIGRLKLLEVGSDCSGWCDRAVTGGYTNVYDDCPAVHGETNALMHSERSQRLGGTLYTNSCPCSTCAKNIANSGVARIVYRIHDADKVRDPGWSHKLMEQSGLKVDVL